MINANISYEDTVDPQGLNCGPDRYQGFFTRLLRMIEILWSGCFTTNFYSKNNFKQLPLSP
jgi:hypothetical protein